jgi:hypothetical protein
MSNLLLVFGDETDCGRKATQTTPPNPSQRPSPASIAKVPRPENETNLSLSMQMRLANKTPKNTVRLVRITIVAELMKQLAGRHTRKSRLVFSHLLKR